MGLFFVAAPTDSQSVHNLFFMVGRRFLYVWKTIKNNWNSHYKQEEIKKCFGDKFMVSDCSLKSFKKSKKHSLFYKLWSGCKKK